MDHANVGKEKLPTGQMYLKKQVDCPFLIAMYSKDLPVTKVSVRGCQWQALEVAGPVDGKIGNT